MRLNEIKTFKILYFIRKKSNLNKFLGWLAQLLRQCNCNTRVVVDARSTLQFVSDKLITCSITSSVQMQFKVPSNANTLNWKNLVEYQSGNYMHKMKNTSQTSQMQNCK